MILESKKEESFSKERISKITELTEYFKQDTYNLHKFVGLIKKPKTIKLLQEEFYFTLIHYIVFSSMWLEYDKVQQLWYSISWLKIIKNSKTHSSLVLSIKQKEKKPLLKRLTSSINTGGVSIKPKLRRSSTLHLLDVVDNNEDQENEMNIKNSEIQILFDKSGSDLINSSCLLILGEMTAIEILKFIKERPWIDYHIDFDKSYIFLLNEINSYFNTQR